MTKQRYSILFPSLKPGQFQGLFCATVEAEHTSVILPP